MTVKRCHIHFAGFEQLTAAVHRRRFIRACRAASELWDCKFDVTNIDNDHDTFSIIGECDQWSSQSDVMIAAPSDIVTHYLTPSPLMRIICAYFALFKGILYGAVFRYFRHAPRFGFFAVFPFIYLAAGFILPLVVANGLTNMWVWNALWAFPAALAFSLFVFLPFANKIHIHFLLASWRFGISMAELNNSRDNDWLEDMQAKVLDHMEGDYDEIIFSSHSMGSITAAHIIGALLEKNPALFDGKKVSFISLGGAVLATAFMSPARILRQRIGLIGQNQNITWLDVQTITDIMNFYKCDPIKLSGALEGVAPNASDIPKAEIVKIRFKKLLNAEGYSAIRQDFLKTHLQFVSGAEVRYLYDFIPLVAGPFVAEERLARLRSGQPALDEGQ